MARYCPDYYSPDEVYPTAAQTLDAVGFGPTGADYTGTVVLPAVATVLDSVSYGASSGSTGTYHAPEAAEVISTAVFGAASGTSGTVVLPAAGTVLDSVTFGAASGTAGTYHAPSVGEVLSTAVFGDASGTSGTYVVAPEAKVEEDYQYGVGGTGSTGTLVVTGSSPSLPTLSLIEVVCLDADYAAEADVDVDFRLVTVPDGDVNTAYKASKKTATSNASGVAQYEAPHGSVVEYKRGVATVWDSVTVGAGDTTSVGSFIGTP